MTSLVNGRYPAYIQTALWSSTDDNDRPMDENYDQSDIDGLTGIKLQRELDQFFKLLLIFPVPGYDCIYDAIIKFDEEYIAHDFWLTRNDHGAGFLDGDYGEYGNQLTAIAKTFSPIDLYVGDDGKIYC